MKQENKKRRKIDAWDEGQNMKQEKDRKISQPVLDDLESGELGRRQENCGWMSVVSPVQDRTVRPPVWTRAYFWLSPPTRFRVGSVQSRSRPVATVCGKALSIYNLECTSIENPYHS
jgi:hypothetical protein